MLPGTRGALAVWKPAPSQNRTAWTSGASDADSCFRKTSTTPVLRLGLISPSAAPVAGQTAVSTHR